MRVLSLKGTSTQHAHRQSRLCEDMQDERAHKHANVGQWRQITGSEELGNTDQNAEEPSPPLQQRETTGQTRSEQCLAINHVAPVSQ